MHSKKKGNIGELGIALDLSKLGLPVFREFGDLSKTDLITIVDDKPIKIQVKARKLDNGKISIKSTKWGPNYQYTYKQSDVDIFAFYCIDTGDIGYMKSDEFTKFKTITFRITEPQNRQIKNVNFLKDRRNFLGILRDYTQDTLTDEAEAEGDDIVQTTTT